MKISTFVKLGIFIWGMILVVQAARPERTSEAHRNDPDTPSTWFRSSGWAQRVLGELTLEQKVSQLFSVSANGVYLSTDDPEYLRLVELVERFEVGGLVFFQGHPLDQAILINDLQERSNLPLLISQDMEWGAGMRIDGATAFPNAMAIGATHSPELAYLNGRITAAEALALGTHQVLAPVVDLNNNASNPVINVRSFGERPELVADLASAFMRGLQDGGVISTAKHFPGHGDTDVDSHSDLPVLSFDRERLDSLELVPFRAVTSAGIKSVMIGHLALPHLDTTPNLPATLSPRIVTDLLRNDIAFDGLIVTDAMHMHGVSRFVDSGEAAVRALEAGVDMILLSDDEAVARKAILTALDTGRLSMERLDASVMRILQAKEWAGLHENRSVDVQNVRNSVGTYRHQVLSEATARRSLTLLRNEGNLLPLVPTPSSMYCILLSDDEDPALGDPFLEALATHGAPARIGTRLLDTRSTPGDYDRALSLAGRFDVVVVPMFLTVRSGSNTVRLNETQRSFLNRLVAAHPNVVVIAFGNPYLTRDLARQPRAFVAAFSSSSATQVVAAEAMLGRSPFEGTLPVSIPGLFPYGSGIKLAQSAPRSGNPEEMGMSLDSLNRIDALIASSIENHAFPGAAVAVGRKDAIVKLDGYGFYTYTSDRRVTPTSPFDLASLTKVIATTTSAMILYDESRLDLDAPVAHYLPDFARHGKDRVTIRHLLTHTSGLRPFRPFHLDGITKASDIRAFILSDTLQFAPGTAMQYSDFNMIVLALAIERITGEPFDRFAEERIFEPIGMKDTGFRPIRGVQDPIVVPTEIDTLFRKRLVQGEVHDETAYLLGGIAGHAGLFSTADDLSRFAYMLVNGGRINGRQIVREETLQLFTTPVYPEQSTRALGWDTRSKEGYSSAGTRFGPRSFGHTGFTGTSIWIDPDQQLFVILLTNRVYPTRANQGHVPVRARLADLSFGSILGPPQLLLPGLDPLKQDDWQNQP